MPKSPPKNKSPRNSSAASASRHGSFTAAQRSQQARGKSYVSSAAGEPYETRQKREHAAQILDSLELLAWHAGARNESVVQTRHHFQNIILGLPDSETIWREEYDVPIEHRVRKRDDGDVVMGGSPSRSARGSPARNSKGKEKEMGKTRLS